MYSAGSTAVTNAGVSDIRSAGLAAFANQGMPVFVTLTDAATMLGFDRRFVVKWLKDRKVVVADYLSEDEPLFFRAELMAYINSCYQKSVEPEKIRQTSKITSLESVNNESFVNTDLANKGEPLGQYEDSQKALNPQNLFNAKASQTDEAVSAKSIAQEQDSYEHDTIPVAKVASTVQLRSEARIVTEFREVSLPQVVLVDQKASMAPTALVVQTNTSDFAKEQNVPKVKDVNITDHLSCAEKFKHFIESLPHGTHAVPGYKYIKVRVNNKVTVIEIVVKGWPKNHKRTLFKHQHLVELTVEDLELTLDIYRLFVKQYEAGALFERINWLSNKMKIRLTTMRQLVLFYIENHDWNTANSRAYAVRMFKRYVDCKQGDEDLRYIKNTELRAMFLEKAEHSHAPSDRDKLLMVITAAYNFACEHPEVEKLEYRLPLESSKRNRGLAKIVPKLGSYVQLMNKAVELEQYDFAACLLLQETVFTRVGATLKLRKKDIDFRDCSIKIAGHKHKNSNNAFYYFTPAISALLQAMLVSREKRSDVANPFIFPALSTTEKSKANFDKEMKLVREALIADLQQSEEGDAFSEIILDIERFSFHRLRGLNIQLLKAINIREGEVENAFNRSVNDKDLAYCDLSDSYQREFKTTKLNSIAKQYPIYSELIERLTAHYRSL